MILGTDSDSTIIHGSEGVTLVSTRGERGRERVVAAAADVFQRAGFERATMARVAEAAGVSKGLPYHHFDSKESLGRAVVGRHLESVLEVLSRWPDGVPTDRLRWFLEQALGHAHANQRSYRLYLSLALQPSTRAMVLEEVALRHHSLAAVDEQLGRIFAALGHPDPETEALVLRATVDGLIQYLLMAPDQFPVQEAVARLMALHGARDHGTRDHGADA